MSKLVTFTVGVSLCDECDRVHLDLSLEKGGSYSLALDDDQWDALFIKCVEMQRARNRASKGEEAFS